MAVKGLIISSMVYLDCVSTARNMRRVIVDLFITGTETSSTTVDWLILYMAAHPQVQTRCRQDIHKVCLWFCDCRRKYSVPRHAAAHQVSFLWGVSRWRRAKGFSVSVSISLSVCLSLSACLSVCLSVLLLLLLLMLYLSVSFCHNISL